VSSVKSYRFLRLYDRDICPNVDHILLKPLEKLFDRNRKVHLQDGKDSAVVVEQKLVPKHFKRANTVTNCIFKIDARKHNKGLFAVIRRLSFRRSEGCRDYIRFEFSNDTFSEKICGNITAENVVAVQDGGGKLKIEINIDTKTPLERAEDYVEFSIVFTGYNDCDGTRTPCFPDDMTACISNEFWNDDIQNCPDPCLDERGCAEVSKRSSSDPSSIIFSALTSLIFTMVIFGSCIWLCWKYRECTDDRDRDRYRDNMPPATMELHSNSGTAATSSPAARPTAPPLSNAPSVEKEDMPPAYDELFPTR